MRTSRNTTLQARAQQALGGVPATYSKAAERFAPGATPVAVESAQAHWVSDIDGRQWLDTTASLGPIILGHGHPKVTEAVMHSQLHGASLPMLTELEVEVAERLLDLNPHRDGLVRFGVNGSDVTQAAVRIARYTTCYEHIITCGYHGFNDFSIAHSPKNGGIVLPETSDYVHPVTWGDTAAVDALIEEHLVAGIIVEMPSLLPTDDPLAWLTRVQAIAAEAGAVFILDNVVTGLRYHPRAQHYLGAVVPDLICYSKALGNGVPIAALVGRRDLMTHCITGEVFMSSTFAGNTLGLGAARAVLEALVDDQEWEALHMHGTRLAREMRHLMHEADMPVDVLGNYARLHLLWRDIEAASALELRTLWIAEHAKRGMLHGPGPIFPMTCWDDDTVSHIMQAAGETLVVMQDVVEGRKGIHEVLSIPVTADVFAVRPPQQ